MSINLEYFRVFYHVATQHNISRAAQLMFLSQPTVSNQLHALEKQIGYSLFYRLPRGVELTPEGTLLFHEIAPAIEHLLEAEKRAKELRQGSEGTIHLSYNANTTEQIFSPFINHFKALYPNITILTCQLSRWSLKKALHSGVIDLAIAARPSLLTSQPDREIPPPDNTDRSPGEITEYLLCTYEETILAGQAFSFLGNDLHHAKDLGKYPLIMQMKQELKTRDAPVAEYYLDLFQQSPPVQQRNIVVTDIDSILNLIKGNFGLGILPSFISDMTLKNDPENFVPIQVQEKMMSNQVILHYSESRRPSLVALKFIEYLLNDPAFSPRKIECSI